MSNEHAVEASPAQQQGEPDKYGLQAPAAEFANMSMAVAGAPQQQGAIPQQQQPVPPQQYQQHPPHPQQPPYYQPQMVAGNGYVSGGQPSAYPQPAVQFRLQDNNVGGAAGSTAIGEGGGDGFDNAGYSHYQHISQPTVAAQAPPPPGMPKSRSEMDRYGGQPVHAQSAQQYAANSQAQSGSSSSVEGGSSENDLLAAPRAPGLGLHSSASQPRLSGIDDGMGVAPRPRVRPGRSGVGQNGEPNPFLTYSRNSIYSSSQTSLHRGSMYGLNGAAAAGGMSAKRMSRTLVSGNNALDMYREAAKKTQDERIQMEYARFLLQSIENLEDPVVREDINVTYSIYMPGNIPGSAAASSASLPLGQQASDVDPENRDKLITEAVYWIKHLQRKGNTEASFIAGTWFEAGKYGIEKDRSKAVQLFTYAAKNHHAAAAFKVASYYEERKSSGRAFSYYQMAAALGDVGANFRMAKVFLDGNFHKKANIKQALVYLRRAAELANSEWPDGALLLGQMYLKEYPDQSVYEVIFYDPEEAQKLLDKAARLGSVEAQYLLGFLFEFGEHGFPVDPVSSTHYYQLAAEQDNAKAQMALSGWYLSGGEGVRIDDRLAFDWGHRAAQQGLTRAMYAMGYYYEMGIGCDKDIGRAKEWYERAAADGSEEAKERLSKGISDVGGSSAESTAALRRHVTQKRQKASARGRSSKKRGGILSRDKDKDDTKCIVM